MENTETKNRFEYQDTYEMANEIKKLQRIANEHKEKISRLEDIVIDLNKQIIPSNELITSFIIDLQNILKKI